LTYYPSRILSSLCSGSATIAGSAKKSPISYFPFVALRMKSAISFGSETYTDWVYYNNALDKAQTYIDRGSTPLTDICIGISTTWSCPVKKLSQEKMNKYCLYSSKIGTCTFLTSLYLIPSYQILVLISVIATNAQVVFCFNRSISLFHSNC